MGTIERNPTSAEPINFLAYKEKLKREEKIAENPKVYMMNFLNWAKESARPTQTRDNYPDEFFAAFNNGKIRGSLVYERTTSDDGSEIVSESLQFRELSGTGRSLGYNVSNGSIALYSFYGDPSQKEFYMDEKEQAKFLTELGAPYKSSDPFPFEEELPEMQLAENI